MLERPVLRRLGLVLALLKSVEQAHSGGHQRLQSVVVFVFLTDLVDGL